MLKVFVFGNQDLAIDNIALRLAKKLSADLKNIKFIYIKPNQDLDFEDNKHIVIFDNYFGGEKLTIFTENDLDKLVLSPRDSVHDFDLAFQLKYLKKLEKIKKLTMILIPIKKEVDYDLIHSTFKKLVAQDIQGS